MLARLAIGSAMTAACATGGALVQTPDAPPQERRIAMTARQYAYEPGVVRVNQGDTIRLRIEAADVVHGFFLEGHDLEALLVPQSPFLLVSRPSEPAAEPEKREEIAFVAGRPGKFRFRCSHTCGTMHPFMVGELVVAPNRLYGAGLGAFVGMLLAGGVLALWGRESLAGARPPAGMGPPA